MLSFPSISGGKGGCLHNSNSIYMEKYIKDKDRLRDAVGESRQLKVYNEKVKEMLQKDMTKETLKFIKDEQDYEILFNISVNL